MPAPKELFDAHQRAKAIRERRALAGRDPVVQRQMADLQVAIFGAVCGCLGLFGACLGPVLWLLCVVFFVAPLAGEAGETNPRRACCMHHFDLTPILLPPSPGAWTQADLARIRRLVTVLYSFESGGSGFVTREDFEELVQGRRYSLLPYRDTA